MVPVRMVQTRIRAHRWESSIGLKRQILSTRHLGALPGACHEDHRAKEGYHVRRPRALIWIKEELGNLLTALLQFDHRRAVV